MKGERAAFHVESEIGLTGGKLKIVSSGRRGGQSSVGDITEVRVCQGTVINIVRACDQICVNWQQCYSLYSVGPPILGGNQ